MSRRLTFHLAVLAAAVAIVVGVAGTSAPSGATGRYANPQLLVETDEVAGMLAAPGVRIVDLRSGMTGKVAYRVGHVPGAAYLDPGELDDPAANAEGFPIRPEAAAALFGRLGIDHETTVVAYDDGGSVLAARFFFVLEYYGHERVRVLNGGLAKWRREGRPLESTVPVTLDMMILQGHAVMRGSKRALVVIDMPFGSYEASKEQAFMSAARVMKETGCGAIKVEGGRRMAESIAFLVERGVPVMGHIGLTPQSINTIGSFRAQGRDETDWGPIEEDARAVAQAGAFSVVIEAVAEPLARRITAAVEIPTIGIGGSVACDGQILVLEDMLGLSPRVPKFVKRYAELGPSIEAAVAAYAADVRARAFPATEHVYPLRTKAK